MSERIPLPDAALTLKAPYPEAMRLLLTGRLEGERRGSRWYVTRESVERERALRDDATTEPSAA